MRILLFGSFWRGSREESYRKAFLKLGCEVEIFDTNAFFSNNAGKSLSLVTRILNRFLWRARAHRLNVAFVKRAVEMNPELIFVGKGKELTPRSLREIKKWNTSLLFNLNTDDFFAPRHMSNTNRWLQKSIPIYHCLFYYKEYALRKEVLEHGAQRVEHIPMSYDPDVHRPMEMTGEEKQKYAADIVFVGNPEAERIGTLEKIAKAGFGLKVYGPGWNKVQVSDTLRSCIVGRGVYAEEMAKVYCGAKVVLVFFRRGDRDLTNSRLFEVPAIGGFMLVERNEAVLRFFEEGKEAECFYNDEELLKKIQYYLAHEEEREKIRAAGHKRCVDSGYSFEGRAKRILEVFHELWSKDTMVN